MRNQNLPIYPFFNLKKNIYVEKIFQKSTFWKENDHHRKNNRKNKARLPINRFLLFSESLIFRSYFYKNSNPGETFKENFPRSNMFYKNRI